MFYWKNTYVKKLGQWRSVENVVSFFYGMEALKMKRPMIGVIPLVDQERDSLWMLPGYMEGIIEAGGIPTMLPLNWDGELLEQIVDRYDGFLLTGGQDLSPKLYGEEPLSLCGECCPRRDEMERKLFAMVFEVDKPLLGICRGIQSINVMLGGTLYQDLPSQLPSEIEHHQTPPYTQPVHEVEIALNTPLYHLLRKRVLPVNSYHHQGIRELSAELRPMACALDGLIEGVYAPGKRYIWAVQWHPELSFQRDDSSKRIFQSFISAAGSK